MDPLSVLASFNKISLFAFIATFGFLIYEIRLLKKEKRKTLNIPKFEDKSTSKVNNNFKTFQLKEDKNNFMKANNTVLFILIFLLLFFAILTLLGFLNLSNKKDAQKTQPVFVNTVYSKGIKIYDEGFKIIKDNEIANYKNKKIIIGVETIADYDIDRARIKVNKTNWELNDITTNFDQNNKVFYIRYLIGDKDSKIKIEAQLHSAKDGWLGD